MKKKMIKIGLCLCVILLFLAIYITVIVQKDCGYAKVKDGITLAEAERLANEDEQSFIIIEKDGGAGIEFAIAYGEHAGIDVHLTGNAPGCYLSSVFFGKEHNTFLVRGVEHNISNRGLPYMEMALIPDPYAIDVISWEIIIPIRRDYQYRNEGKRFFSPSKYLDQFDVDQGDYIINHNTLSQPNFESYLTSPEQEILSPSGKYMLSLESYDDNGVMSFKVAVSSGERTLLSDEYFRTRDVFYALWDDES